MVQTSARQARKAAEAAAIAAGLPIPPKPAVAPEATPKKRSADEAEHEAKKEAKAAKKARKEAKAAAASESPAAKVAEDQTIICKDCDRSFIFLASEQELFAAKGFTAKTRCQDCVQAKKAKYSEAVDANAPPLPTYDAKTEGKLDAWVAAKRSKDFETADRLRWELRSDNINPEDARPVGRPAAAVASPTKKTGHSAKCFNCGKQGHASADCPKAAGQTACYYCGSEEHQGKDCPEPRESKDPKNARCYGCGQIGHFSRDCPAPQRNSNACYTCGQTGHVTRYCPSVVANPKAKKKNKPVGACHAWTSTGACARGWECYFAHAGGGPTRTTPDEPPV